MDIHITLHIIYVNSSSVKFIISDIVFNIRRRRTYDIIYTRIFPGGLVT